MFWELAGWIRRRRDRARRRLFRIKKQWDEIGGVPPPAVLLREFDGRTFRGVIYGVADARTVHFDVFAEGRMIASTRARSLRLSGLGENDWSFSFSLGRAIKVGTPGVAVKHEGTDRFVDIAPDLKGFVNNGNDTAVPSGHLLEDPLFFLPVACNAFWPRIDDALVSHVTGGATLEAYHGVGYAMFLDVLGVGLLHARSIKVAEIGCGCGRVAQFVAPMLEPSSGGSYDGYDTWRTGIDWATANISAAYPHARFHHLGPSSGSAYQADRSYRLDLADESEDTVLAISLFTHLRHQAASSYISDIARVLKPGGKAYLTFYASKQQFHVIQPDATCEEDDYGVYFVKPDSEDAFVDEAVARQMFERSGLRVLGVKYGHWRGSRYAYRGHAGHQDVFVLRKP